MSCLIIVCILFMVAPSMAANPEEMTWYPAANASFDGKTISAMAEYDGMLWIICGKQDSSHLNEIWSSGDGQRWTLVSSNPPFSGPRPFELVVFDNKLVAMGNDRAGETSYTHVWSSTDGVTWTLLTDTAPFPYRMCSSILVFDDRIWVIGGDTKPSAAQPTWDLSNDVWYSDDGMSWKKATDHAGFSPRSRTAATVYQGKMWIIGGWNGNGVYNDVWYSEDGITWKEATAHAGFSPREGHAATVYNGVLWVVGGETHPENPPGSWECFNDVWYSSDGVQWSRAPDVFGFPSRRYHSLVSHDNRLWVGGGARDFLIRSDVWYSSSGAIITPDPSGDGILIRKSVSPQSIKQGTSANVTIVLTNTGEAPVHDIEIRDSPLAEFTVLGGSYYSSKAELLPNESMSLIYTLSARKSGRFMLSKASVLYAREDGNYQRISSNTPEIVVLESLIEQQPEENTIEKALSGCNSWFFSWFKTR